MAPIDFKLTVSKVKVTGIFTIISLSAQMLKNARPQCIDFDIVTFEACRIRNLAMHWLSNLRFGKEVVLEL
jgi:hypothetical protein